MIGNDEVLPFRPTLLSHCLVLLGFLGFWVLLLGGWFRQLDLPRREYLDSLTSPLSRSQFLWGEGDRCLAQRCLTGTPKSTRRLNAFVE